jgi:hypothetical protein
MSTIQGGQPGIPNDYAKLSRLEAKANNAGVGNSDGVLTAQEMVAAFKSDFKKAKAENPGLNSIAFMEGWIDKHVPAAKQTGVENMLTIHLDFRPDDGGDDLPIASQSALAKETFAIPFQPRLPDDKVRSFDFSGVTSSSQKGTLIHATDTGRIEAAGREPAPAAAQEPLSGRYAGPDGAAIRPDIYNNLQKLQQ